MKYQAVWNGAIIAEAEESEILQIEGNIYFHPDKVKKEFLEPSKTNTTCPWKGEASYYNLLVNGMKNEDAAWYYPNPKDGSTQIVSNSNNNKFGGDFSNFIAFWRGVEVKAL